LTAETAGPRTERFIPVGGLRLCLDDWGPTDAPVVLLAHGMWCDAGMFQGLAQLLAREARVIVPDLRAHGRSEVPSSRWSVADLADDLAATLDQLEIPHVLLAGFSMGGMAATEFALKYPERLSGLLLIGTSVSAEDFLRTTQINTLSRIIQLTGAPSFMPTEASKSTFSPSFRRRNPKEITRWESVVRAMPRQALIQGLKAVVSRRPLLEQIHEIKVPVTIVSGGADEIMKPKHSEAIHRRIPGSKLVVYPNVGHAVPTERPRDVAELVEEMVKG
jgi:pimeloyl-ACP methyl ester carboxylesterase